jgi:hypothetical protein
MKNPTHFKNLLNKAKSFVEENLNKSEPLQKGSFQARNKFNPQSPKYSTVQDLLADWTGEYHDSSIREEVGKLADSMDLKASKNRIFHKLSKMTHSRVSPTGEREFLLHRGVSPDEHEVKYHDGNHHSDHYSSWTPHYHVAEKFAKDGVIGRPNHPTTIHSAWIPESKISLMPNMYINAHPYKDENEIILKPGIFKAKANKGNV